MPGLFHIQVAASHVDCSLGFRRKNGDGGEDQGARWRCSVVFGCARADGDGLRGSGYAQYSMSYQPVAREYRDEEALMGDHEPLRGQNVYGCAILHLDAC